MKAFLLTLHVLGWVALVSFGLLFVLTWVAALVPSVAEVVGLGGGEAFRSIPCAFVLALPGLAIVIATRVALRGLKDRELAAPGLKAAMDRPILLTLHVLGWVAFGPFALWSVLMLVMGIIILFVSGPFAPGRDWEEALVGSAIMLGCSLPGLAAAIVTRIALRRSKERDRTAPGFEPIMDHQVPSGDTPGDG